MRVLGLEPRTYGLKGRCSTAELHPQGGGGSPRGVREPANGKAHECDSVTRDAEPVIPVPISTNDRSRQAELPRGVRYCRTTVSLAVLAKRTQR